jgi:hypothetical protein
MAIAGITRTAASSITREETNGPFGIHGEDLDIAFALVVGFLDKGLLMVDGDRILLDSFLFGRE